METNQTTQKSETISPIQAKQLPKVKSEKATWVKPVRNIVVVGTVSIALLLAAGGLFRVLAWTMSGWNEFKGAIKK